MNLFFFDNTVAIIVPSALFCHPCGCAVTDLANLSYGSVVMSGAELYSDAQDYILILD